MGYRKLGQTLARRVTWRSAAAAVPFWGLAGLFLLVCGFGVRVWGLDVDYFERVITFQLMAMHAGLFLGAAAAARPKTVLRHALRLVAFAVLCAAYSAAGHQENGVDGVLLIWSLIVLSCIGVIVGAASQNRGFEMMGRSAASMVVLFLVIIPFGIWNVSTGVGSVALDETPIIGAPYFAILGALEFFRFTAGVGGQTEHGPVAAPP